MPIITANAISFQFADSSIRIPTIDLVISKGDIVLVQGPSGSGKSTLARMLSGLIPNLYKGKMEGAVTIATLDTRTTPLWRLSEVIGMVFQNPANQMLEHTVQDEIIFGLENLGLERGEVYQQLEASLTDFNLHHLQTRKPQTLSGGEQQKLALAAIMARSPQVLILDEPFSMLDITASRDLVQSLRQLSAAGTTIIIFEHRAEILASVPNLKIIALNGSENPRPQPTPIDISKLFPPIGENWLKATDLSVALDDTPILENISFEIPSGKSLAIVGRNGTGKTTLLRALAGLEPHDGTITVNGQKPELRLVFQNADLQLFNASVREEILFRLENPDLEHYQTILNLLCLQEYENSPPLLLSEGEKKRVALAAMLMSQPVHGILLDEPSLGQDNYHKQILIHLAQQLKAANHIIIYATHDLQLAAAADQILLLGDDGVVAHGPASEILKKPDLWKSVGLYIPKWLVT